MKSMESWTKQSVRKEYLKYVCLNILSMIGISYYILVDTYFIGNGVGAVGLTALNLAIPIFCIQQALSFLFSVGLGTKYAILKAQKNDDLANSYVTMTLLSAAVVGIVFAICINVFSKEVAILMGAKGDMVSLAATYTKTVLSFTPFFILSSTMNNLIKNDQNPKLAMLAMISGSLSNIILDYVFIYPMKLGMFGAALATGIAPVVNLSIVSIHIWKKKNGFHLVFKKLKLSYLGIVSKLGLTAAITELASGIIVMLFNLTILGLTGDLGVAAYGVVANLAIVVMAIFNGIAQGIQPMISTSYGKNDTAKMKLTLRYALESAFLSAALMYGILYWFANPIVELFNGEHIEQLQHIAVEGTRLYFVGIFFCGFSVVMTMYFNSKEEVKNSFFIAVLRGGLVMAPTLGVLVKLLNLEMRGVWLSFPISEAVILSVVFVLYMKNDKR